MEDCKEKLIKWIKTTLEHGKNDQLSRDMVLGALGFALVIGVIDDKTYESLAEEYAHIKL